ncbi:MAG: PAS domain-containing hybrid sensor histidine kinase/response regulator, partial [Planctomycetia bacterium]|nr:PAS domain-containing hybrid sensor histidine kinase/response regulator [Planctomycetia bacterium]
MRTSTKPTPSIDHTRGWLVPLLGVNLTGIVLALGFPPLIGVALLVALIGNIWVCTRLRAVLIALAHAYDQNGRQAAHHAALLNAAADAILICKNNGAIREANPAAARLFGYHRDELKSRSIRDLLPDTSLNVVKTDCYELFGTVSAFQGRRKDGKAFPVSVALSKVRLDNEGLYVVIVHDLTALHQARDEAQMATRAKSAFLLAASHELRTPLNGILGAAELLSHTALDSTQRQLVETLSYCGEELQTSVEQVIDFSKLESGQVRLESTAFAPDEVFDALDRTWRPRAEAKGLRFTVRASLPSQIMGDSARLSHLVGWLIENAIVAQAAAVSPCPSSGGFVEVWATTEGNAITICVKDERPIRAMSEEQSEGVKGLRLGVSLAIRLTRLMGGSIALDSVAGRGR